MLSDSQLKKLHRKEQEKMMKIADRDGLWIRVSKKGKITFYIRYRFAGTAADMDVGSYPEISLRKARDLNIHYRGLAQQGRNPKIEKEMTLDYFNNVFTLKMLVDLWYEKEAVHRIKNHKNNYAALKNYVLPKFGELPAAEITTHKWLDLLEPLSLKVPGQTRIILSLLKSVYSFGIRRRIIELNPLAGITEKRDLNIDAPIKDRCLSEHEIKLLLLFIHGSSNRLYRNTRMLHLALIYGCRISELRLAELEHFDFNKMIWIVPAENHKIGHKTKRPLKRPITKTTKRIITELFELSGTKYLFYSQTLKRSPGRSTWYKWLSQCNRWLRCNGYEEIDKCSIHDLRRTMRTNMSELAEYDIAEIMIGHSFGRIRRTYDHYDYIEEQRAAYEAWELKLETILNGEDNVTVVNFKK